MSSFDIQLGVFRIGELRLGLPLACLKEVIPLDNVQPFALQAPYIIGGIDLRGTLIPLINLQSFIGAEAQAGDDRIIVIASYQQALLGIIADSLDGVSESEPHQRSSFELDGGGPQIIKEAFQSGEGDVNILSPEALFSLPGLPKVKAVENQSLSTFAAQYSSVSGHLMLMQVAELYIAVKPTAVHATILLSEILPPVVESDFYIGDTIYGEQKIPVVSTHELLGQGRQPDNEKEAFLIRYPDGIIAFAVNQVVSVLPVHRSQVSVIPAGTVPNQKFLAGAIAADEFANDIPGADYLLILDEYGMVSEPSLASIARLTLEQRKRAGEVPKKDDPKKPEGAETTEKPMLVFDAGQLWAADITDVSEVLPLVESVNVFSESGYAQGLVFSRNQPIPVYCTSMLTFSPPPEELTATSSVLVIDVDGGRVGLMVTRLIGVETSLWIKNERAPMTIAGGEGGTTRVDDLRSVVRTRSDSGPRTLPSLDLKKIAAALIKKVDSSAPEPVSRAAGE